MKRTLLLVLLCLALLPAFSQETYVDIMDRISATDYIFEGVVLKTHAYQTGDQKNIYTSNVIQVTKIFKGGDQLGCGTIELITDGGQLTDVGLDVSHALELHVGDQGIFMTNATGKEPPTNYFPFTIPTKVEATFDWQ